MIEGMYTNRFFRTYGDVPDDISDENIADAIDTASDAIIELDDQISDLVDKIEELEHEREIRS